MINKTAILIGSFGKESFNRKIAENMIRLAPESMEIVGDLPMNNEVLKTENSSA